MKSGGVKVCHLNNTLCVCSAYYIDNYNFQYYHSLIVDCKIKLNINLKIQSSSGSVSEMLICTKTCIEENCS